MHVSVHIVLWNDKEYAPGLFASIHAQTHRDITVRLIDNGSNAEDVAFVMKHEPHWLVSRQTKHMGFGAAQNHLLRLALDRHPDDREHAILIADSHTIWHPDAVLECVKVFNEHPDIDVVQPKVLRAFSEQGDIDAGTVQSDILDTTGLMLRSDWHMTERGAGEMDTGQYDTETDIFGASATFMMIRASAARSVMVGETLFDAEFESGCEDEDVAFRLRRGGHTTRYVPSARVHHYQGMFPVLRPVWWRRTKATTAMRRALGTPARLRNTLWVFVKNLPLGSLLGKSFSIITTDVRRIIVALCVEGGRKEMLAKLLTQLPGMLRKRFIIQAREHVPMKELRRYIIT